MPASVNSPTSRTKRARPADMGGPPDTSGGIDEHSFQHEDPEEEDEEDDDDGPAAGKKSEKKAGRRKIKIEFISDKSRRHITFSKRKAGIMKKAYELSTLTGTQVLLLVVSETGLVYTFTTAKLQPLVTQPEGKNLIQACLNAPNGTTPTAASASAGTGTTASPTAPLSSPTVSNMPLARSRPTATPALSLQTGNGVRGGDDEDGLGSEEPQQLPPTPASAGGVLNSSNGADSGKRARRRTSTASSTGGLAGSRAGHSATGHIPLSPEATHMAHPSTQEMTPTSPPTSYGGGGTVNSAARSPEIASHDMYSHHQQQQQQSHAPQGMMAQYHPQQQQHVTNSPTQQQTHHLPPPHLSHHTQHMPQQQQPYTSSASSSSLANASHHQHAYTSNHPPPTQPQAQWGAYPTSQGGQRR